MMLFEVGEYPSGSIYYEALKVFFLKKGNHLQTIYVGLWNTALKWTMVQVVKLWVKKLVRGGEQTADF